MRRREFITLAGSAAVWPLVAQSQHRPSKTYSILWVSTESQPDPFIAGFREGMREHGYVEGQNLAFILRYAPGDPAALRAMLPDLLRVPADLIVSSGPAIVAMKATTVKPVLFAISGDPVELGLAESLSRPGKNFTGSTFMSLDVAQKRVQLLKELLPDMRSLAILSWKPHPGEKSEHKATIDAADALSIRLSYVPFDSGAELDSALERVATAHADAMLVFPDGVTLVHRAKIAGSPNHIACHPCSGGANTATLAGSRATAVTSGPPISASRRTLTGSCAARSRQPFPSNSRPSSNSS
jgi:putative ABC transport system substrate-binding protein